MTIISSGEESNPYHRYTATIALGMTRAEQAIPYLRDALTSDDKTLRGLSISALGNIGGDAVRVLSDFLRTCPEDDWLVVESLSNHVNRDKEARKAVIEAVNRGSHFARIKAISVLKERQVKDKESIQALTTATGDSEIRYYVAKALADIGDLTAIPTLVSMLRDQSDMVRKQAIRALAKILSRTRWVRTVPVLFANDSDTVCMTDTWRIRQLEKTTSELKRASLKTKDYDALRVALETEGRIAIASFASVLRAKGR